MSKQSLFAMTALVLLAACASPSEPSTNVGEGSQRQGPSHPTCQSPRDPSQSQSSASQVGVQEKQCTPME
jgi:hypothetical protein